MRVRACTLPCLRLQHGWDEVSQGDISTFRSASDSALQATRQALHLGYHLRVPVIDHDMCALHAAFTQAVGGDRDGSLSQPGPVNVAQLLTQCGIGTSEEQMREVYS